jgi:hypothetical protein
MKKVISYILIGLLLLAILQKVVSTDNKNTDLVKIYKVNKVVSDFPEKEDFSTPEAAYAVINRVMASGKQGAWQKISVKSLKNKLPSIDTENIEVRPEDVKTFLSARIIEVRIFKDCYAVVIAELSYNGKPSRFDHRAVNLEDGKWLNVGQSTYDNLDKARVCAKSWARYVNKPEQPKIDDPKAYLKPFVDFLKTKGQEPVGFVMKALAQHKVVIIGETHHRPWYWAFNSVLVTHPDFSKNVGTIYLELPSNNQHLVDKFLTGKTCDELYIIEMLRDNLWMGWPDQPMLDFFVTVCEVNRDLKPEEKLRIELVDMQRPWKEIQKREDWLKYNVDRDKFMADNIIQDIRGNAQEKRNALFIVGVGHTALNLKYFEGSPIKMTGWYLYNELGPENVYTIFQHRCAIANVGRVDGRLCLGLFDSAFAAIGNRKIAFPLNTGPFGKQLFDAFPDRPPMSSSYKDGFNAYLYLGPLEDEIFSPLIPRFYTDDFVKELDRRYRLMYKKGLKEGCRLDRLDAKSFIDRMSDGSWGSWGKPRKWRTALGPINAWHYSGDWKQTIQEKKKKQAMEHPEEIKKAALKLFSLIRNANYKRYRGRKWSHFPVWRQDLYTVASYGDQWVEWICNTFQDNPIKSVELGDVFKGEGGLPTVPYKLTLQDGKVLEGNLPFKYYTRGQYWKGIHGIDWHLGN